MLVKYVREWNRHPYACVIVDNNGKVGLSVCSPKDRFTKKEARAVALENLRKGKRYSKIIPKYWSHRDVTVYDRRYKHPCVTSVAQHIHDEINQQMKKYWLKQIRRSKKLS